MDFQADDRFVISAHSESKYTSLWGPAKRTDSTDLIEQAGVAKFNHPRLFDQIRTIRSFGRTPYFIRASS
jgi:hypothetical protein